MPDGDPSPHPGDPNRPEPEIADAELLFREDTPSVTPSRDPVMPTASEKDEVIELDHSVARPELPPKQAASPAQVPGPTRRAPAAAPPPLPPAAARPGPDVSESAREREFREASKSAFATASGVDQVWSRRDEWGASLIVLGCWSIILLSLLYVAIAVEAFNFAFVLLVLGGLYWLYLCYPILITLEIPVRLTPESAVKDYYGALSHHMPHYRRMWLLLGREARTTPYFGSFEGFCAYWKGRMRDLKEQGRAGPTTPLQFQVESFNAEKSTGRTEINAQFVVKVFVRGRRDEGAIATVPMRIDLVRGPDKMWYLGDGTLPEPPTEEREG
jgi:hypothetical protein